MKTIISITATLFIAGLVFAGGAEAGGKRDGSSCHVHKSCKSKLCVRVQPQDKFGVCCGSQGCAELGAQCGEIDNGCGTPIPCGTCDPGSNCVSNQCVSGSTTTSTTSTTTSTTSTTTSTSTTTTTTTTTSTTSTTLTTATTTTTVGPTTTTTLEYVCTAGSTTMCLSYHFLSPCSDCCYPDGCYTECEPAIATSPICNNTGLNDSCAAAIQSAGCASVCCGGG